MSASEINAVIDQLSHASVDTVVSLSFAGRGLKLDNESDGKLKGTSQLVDTGKMRRLILGMLKVENFFLDTRNFFPGTRREFSTT